MTHPVEEALRDLAHSVTHPRRGKSPKQQQAYLNAIAAIGTAIRKGADPIDIAEALAAGHLLVLRRYEGKSQLSLSPDLLEALSPGEIADLAFHLPQHLTEDGMQVFEDEADFQRGLL
jgi:hypothetical protein